MLLRLVILFLLFGVVKTQAQTVISAEAIPQFLEEVMQKQRDINKQITEYTATNRQRTRVFDDKGKFKEEVVLVSESYQSNDRNVEVVLSKNGKSLSEGKIEKERKEAVKALTEDELKRVRTESTTPQRRGPEFGLNYGTSKDRQVRLSTFDLFRLCQFSNPRAAEWQGRSMIALDFQPHPKFEPSDRRLAPFGHLTGTVWIDAIDKVTVRVEAFLADDTTRKDPALIFEYVRMPDGVWLIAHSRLNTTRNPAYFNDVHVDWEWEKTNYQRFSAQAGEAKLDAPKPKQ